MIKIKHPKIALHVPKIVPTVFHYNFTISQMASLTKKKTSPYWFACYTLADGRRTKRSTKHTDRRKAQTLAEQYEKAAKLASQKRLGEAQARRVIADIYEATSGERLLSATARDFLTRWAETRKVDTAHSTSTAYAQIVRDFLISLGSRADLDIGLLSKADIAKYRNAVLARTSVASANKALKYVRIALGAAYRDGYTQENPAAKLETLKRPVADRQQRRVFTLPELKLILNSATDDWRGLILFGAYTGQRLGDLARLNWQNVDTSKNELRFTTSKTGRQMHIPLAKPLVEHIENMDAGDDPAAPLFPKAFADVSKAKSVAPLSKQFHSILVSAGLAKPWEDAAAGKGGKRAVHPLTFHCLRHTATSLLKNAGVSEIVARDIIGHESEAVSRSYSHVDEDAKRKAIATLPELNLNGPPKSQKRPPPKPKTATPKPKSRDF